MAMLDRYRKTAGGFLQLLALLETCGPTKQQRFLEIIRIEDPRWADAIREKMLDVNKIYAWKDETLAEILGRLQDLTIGTALHGATPETRDRVHHLTGHSRWRKIEDVLTTSSPSPAEVATANMKLIETVRAMVKDGALRFDKIDPSLIVEDKIEEKLAKAASNDPAPAADAPASVTTLKFGAYDEEPTAQGGGTPGLSDTERAELLMLRKKFSELAKENASLRLEVGNLRHKLDQIRKIA